MKLSATVLIAATLFTALPGGPWVATAEAATPCPVGGAWYGRRCNTFRNDCVKAGRSTKDCANVLAVCRSCTTAMLACVATEKTRSAAGKRDCTDCISRYNSCLSRVVPLVKTK